MKIQQCFYPGQFTYESPENNGKFDETNRMHQINRLKAAGSLEITCIGDILRWTHLQITGAMVANASELVLKHG